MLLLMVNIQPVGLSVKPLLPLQLVVPMLHSLLISMLKSPVMPELLPPPALPELKLSPLRPTPLLLVWRLKLPPLLPVTPPVKPEDGLPSILILTPKPVVPVLLTSLPTSSNLLINAFTLLMLIIMHSTRLALLLPPLMPVGLLVLLPSRLLSPLLTPVSIPEEHSQHLQLAFSPSPLLPLVKVMVKTMVNPALCWPSAPCCFWFCPLYCFDLNNNNNNFKNKWNFLW